MLSFSVVFNHISYVLELPANSTVEQVKHKVTELTCVPLCDQKLYYKTKELLNDETLLSNGVISGSQLILSPLSAKKVVSDVATAYKRPNRYFNTIHTLRQANPLGTRHVVLENYSNSASAMEILTQLSSDIAIIDVMNKHRWAVDRLCELDPKKDEDILGLHTKFEISLRLRNSNGFFMAPKEILDTLYHEMAHFEFTAHIDEFWALKAQIQKECETIRLNAIHEKLGALVISPPLSKASTNTKKEPLKTLPPPALSPTLSPQSCNPPLSSQHSTSHEYFPIFDMVTYEDFQHEKMQKAILTANSSVPEKLSKTDIKSLQNLFGILQKTSYYHSSKVEELHIRIVEKLLAWPIDKLVPVIDLIRLLLTHPHGSEQVCVIFPEVMDKLLSFTVNSCSNQYSALCMISIRCITNVFKNRHNRKYIEAKEEQLLGLVSESAKSLHKEMWQSTAALITNLSVMYRAHPKPQHGKVICLQAIHTLLLTLSSPPRPPVDPSSSSSSSSSSSPSSSSSSAPAPAFHHATYATRLTLSALGTLTYRDHHGTSVARQMKLKDVVARFCESNHEHIPKCAAFLVAYEL